MRHLASNIAEEKMHHAYCQVWLIKHKPKHHHRPTPAGQQHQKGYYTVQPYLPHGNTCTKPTQPLPTAVSGCYTLHRQTSVDRSSAPSNLPCCAAPLGCNARPHVSCDSGQYSHSLQQYTNAAEPSLTSNGGLKEEQAGPTCQNLA